MGKNPVNSFFYKSTDLLFVALKVKVSKNWSYWK